MVSPIQLTPGMDAGTLASAVNDTFRQIEAENRTKIVKDENGINRIIIGRYADGTYGIKISQPGVDVTSASDSQLILNSDNNLFKIIKTDVHTFLPADFANSGNSYLTKYANYSFAHNQDKPPIVLAFLQFALGGTTQLPYTSFDYDTGSLNYIAYATAGATDVSLTIRSKAVLSPSVPIRYYVLQETAS